MMRENQPFQFQLPEQAVNPLQGTKTLLTNKVQTSVQQATDWSQQKIDQVADTTQKLGETISDRTHSIVQYTTSIPGQVKTAITSTTTQVGEKIAQTGDQVVHTVQNPIVAFWAEWSLAHPRMLWAVHHPLLTLLLFLLSGLTLWGLLKAFLQFAEQVWLATLQAPLRFARWALNGVGRSFHQISRWVLGRVGLHLPPPAPLPVSTPVAVVAQEVGKEIGVDRKQRLSELLARLEALRQEQNQLLQEVASMMDE